MKWIVLQGKMKTGLIHIKIGLVAVVWLLQTFALPVVYVHFQIQKAYIAANLCENRFQPMLECEGSCILSQKLKAAQKETSEKEQTNIAYFVFISNLSVHDAVGEEFQHSDKIIHFIANEALYISNVSSAVFRPPIA